MLLHLIGLNQSVERPDRAGILWANFGLSQMTSNITAVDGVALILHLHH